MVFGGGRGRLDMYCVKRRAFKRALGGEAPWNALDIFASPSRSKLQPQTFHLRLHLSPSTSSCHSQLPKLNSQPRVFQPPNALVIKTTINSARLAHWVRCRRPCHQTPVESGPLEARASRLSLPQHAGRILGLWQNHRAHFVPISRLLPAGVALQPRGAVLGTRLGSNSSIVLKGFIRPLV